jgi:4-hydroxy-2-oxoheptanedioate aldolase
MSLHTAETMRDRLAARRVLGAFVKLPATESVDILAGAGFDFAIIDLEHSQLTDGDALRLVRHATAIGFHGVVRLPETDHGLINRLLEAGAAGIQLSTVRRVEQVRELVAATRYPPAGQRSVSLAHPMAGYGAMSLREAVSVPHPLLIGQIETAETSDPLEQLLGAGLDVAFIGTTDLLVDLGLDAERQQARVAQIERAIAAAGIVYGSFAGDAASIPANVRYVALSSDLAMLGAMARTMAAHAG